MHPHRLTRASLLAIVALALAAPAADAQNNNVSPAKPSSHRHDRVRVPPPSQAGSIVCTKLGCRPLPPHCHAETQFTWEGDPTGYQLIVCP